MFILDQIPTVAEAQANLNALTQELTLLWRNVGASRALKGP